MNMWYVFIWCPLTLTPWTKSMNVCVKQCNPFLSWSWMIRRRHKEGHFKICTLDFLCWEFNWNHWWLATLGRFEVLPSWSCYNIIGLNQDNFKRVVHSTRLSLLGQELRLARHWLLPALHLCSANPLAVNWFSRASLCLSRVDPGSLLTPATDSWLKGMGLLKTTNSSTCGTSISLQQETREAKREGNIGKPRTMFSTETLFHLEAAVERRNLLRDARRSEDGESVASRADSGGREAFPPDPPVSCFNDWMLVVAESSDKVNFFLFLLPTRSLNSFRSLSHLVAWILKHLLIFRYSELLSIKSLDLTMLYP